MNCDCRLNLTIFVGRDYGQLNDGVHWSLYSPGNQTIVELLVQREYRWYEGSITKIPPLVQFQGLPHRYLHTWHSLVSRGTKLCLHKWWQCLQISLSPWVDFIEQLSPYPWNCRSAPTLFAQIYSNLALCICALRSTYCIFSQILVRFTPYPQLLWNPPHPWCKDVSTDWQATSLHFSQCHHATNVLHVLVWRCDYHNDNSVMSKRAYELNNSTFLHERDSPVKTFLSYLVSKRPFNEKLWWNRKLLNCICVICSVCKW
jgi:hypothetical protein